MKNIAVLKVLKQKYINNATTIFRNLKVLRQFLRELMLEGVILMAVCQFLDISLGFLQWEGTKLPSSYYV